MNITGAQFDVLAFLRGVCEMKRLPFTPELPENPALLAALLTEEAGETELGLKAGDLPGIVDGCIDTMFVCLNILTQCGVDAARFWELVADANLAKAGGPVDANGKRLKPAGWKPPAIEQELRRQGWQGK